MPKLDEQIHTLELKLQQLKLRQQRADARRREFQAHRERQAETRRQFVVGSIVLAKVREGTLDPLQLRQWLDAAVTRPSDRALFDLPPRDGVRPA